MPLLEVKNLCKSFTRNGSSFMAVDHLSLEIGYGECLGLVGESGCGKSTTAQLIAGLLKEDSGQVLLQGTDITKPKEMKKKRRYLQMIFQNPADSFDPRYTVLDSTKQGIRSFTDCSSSELEALAREALAYVGLKEAYFHLPLSRLSGGECQRVAIARAIIGEPQLIICDEATSALDVSVQAQIISLLQKLMAEKQTSLLFITHDLALASSICSKIAVMYQGSIVEYGPAGELLAKPQHPYTRMLLSCVLPTRSDDEYHLPDCDAVNQQTANGCKFYEYCRQALPQCAQERPLLRESSGDSNRRIACFRDGQRKDVKDVSSGNRKFLVNECGKLFRNQSQ